jgi:V/A-type H+-transporting ATPase subunit I
LTQGRAKKGIFSKFFSGLLSLYNITGIFSDVLSYSRLFALGLSSAIIGMVFNILASMLTGAWYSIVFAVAIFVVGHVFNILINLLGAFVHTSRLQYIEFFGKFFEGGGHTFTPLTIKTKYIDLTN